MDRESVPGDLVASNRSLYSLTTTFVYHKKSLIRQCLCHKVHILYVANLINYCPHRQNDYV